LRFSGHDPGGRPTAMNARNPAGPSRARKDGHNGQHHSREELQRDTSHLHGARQRRQHPTARVQARLSDRLQVRQPRDAARLSLANHAGNRSRHVVPAPLAPTAAPDSRQQQEEGFRQLRALWRRGWPRDETDKAVAIARSAFRSACALAEPAEIIEAAKTWIAAADAPRFLQPLPQWLAARGWETPPPQRARSSPPRRHQRGGRGNGKVNVADVFFAIAAEDDARRAAS
jgi:hypothetical protein